MGVYIKGMDMPKSCLAGNGCKFRHICEPYKNFIPTELKSGMEWVELAKQIVEQMQESRLDACPLVEVSTPHGRLIDVDYADEYAYDELELAHTYHTGWEAARSMQKIYQNVQTIIPAEPVKKKEE